MLSNYSTFDTKNKEFCKSLMRHFVVFNSFLCNCAEFQLADEYGEKLQKKLKIAGRNEALLRAVEATTTRTGPLVPTSSDQKQKMKKWRVQIRNPPLRLVVTTTDRSGCPFLPSYTWKMRQRKPDYEAVATATTRNCINFRPVVIFHISLLYNFLGSINRTF